MKHVQIAHATRETRTYADTNISRYTARCDSATVYDYFGTVKVVRSSSGTYTQDELDAKMHTFETWFGNEKFSSFISRNTGWVVLKKVYDDVEFITEFYYHVKRYGVQILDLSNLDDRNHKGKDAVKWFLVIACEQTAIDMGLEYRWEVDGADNYEFHLD